MDLVELDPREVLVVEEEVVEEEEAVGVVLGEAEEDLVEEVGDLEEDLEVVTDPADPLVYLVNFKIYLKYST